MRYLGGLRGAGTLRCGDATIGRADYDFDGFLTTPRLVTSSGEIRAARETLQEVYGRNDCRLLTDDGRLLTLRFSGKRPRPTDDSAAHVEVGGELPVASEWRR